MTKEYDIVIGLEIHAELNTNSKIFCGCQNKFGQDVNTTCCPVCVGFPGALPVLNKLAVELAILAGLTCGCQINDIAIMERKNYFYPDLSKAYQISQMQKPFCLGGKIELENGKIIRLNRIHLEEDAGKLVHGLNNTYIDYNRGGVPLIECVTEPDITTAAEAVEFLNILRNRFVFAKVANCKMEQGGMRCDVNLSVKPKGENKLGTRTEMKNLNSFKSVAKAIESEAKRQIEVLKSGGVIVQETRKWDDDKEKSFSMRTKEDSHDYRYFPDPDLLTIKIDDNLINNIKANMPLLQEQKIEIYLRDYNLPAHDANIMASTLILSEFFDECVKLLKEPKEISNWIMTEVLKMDCSESVLISAQHLVDIIKMQKSGKISRTNAKVLLPLVADTKKPPMDLAKQLNMLNDDSEFDLEKIISEIIAQNPKAVADYAATPDKICQFFVGNVMKATKGKANATKTKEIITKLLKQ